MQTHMTACSNADTDREERAKPNSPRAILVLLPVYNGAAYLRAQVNSILEQTYPSVFLLCRDDGSTDSSLEILKDIQRHWPERVHLLQDHLGNLGASSNFAWLMQQALQLPLPAAFSHSPLPPYIALSDQDDLWHPDKLAICADRLEALEKAHPDTPALVHSDLCVVAHDGSPIAPSMARYQGLQFQQHGFAAQLLSNTLTGCTALMNRRLIEASLPIPPEAIMHDWWLSLVASAWGVRDYIDQPLIDYRQHTSNAVGAKEHIRQPLKHSRIKRLFDNRHAEIFQLNARQANAFLNRYRSRLNAQRRALLWFARGLAIPFPPLQRILYRMLRKA